LVAAAHRCARAEHRTCVMTVREARQAYFDANGFSTATYNDRWVKLKLGVIRFRARPLASLTVAFPNTRQRKRAIPLHDLHHVATGYDTTLVGEAEIGAWELGGGCGNYWAAWVLNGFAMMWGIALAPRRTWRAWRRGRRSKTLYHAGWSDDLLGLTVDELRA